IRLNSSMQPSSTRRSPRIGSRPVVSVSRTISRMVWWLESGESGPPSGHFSNLGQDVLDLRADGIKPVRGIHDEIRALALLHIGHLTRNNGIELFGIHGATRQHPLALQFR